MPTHRVPMYYSRLAWVLTASLFPMFFLSGCEKPQSPPPPAERPPAPVTTAAAIAQDVPLYLDEIGRCVAREAVSIEPQVSGRITEIHFTDGADVKRGDLLFTIDPRPYRAMQAQAEANLAQEHVALELGRTELARVEKLVSTKAVAQQEYDERKNAVAAMEAAIQSREAAVEMAKINVDYTSIRSPIDGRTGKRLVDVGNVVTANSGTGLLMIQRVEPIYVEFTVTEANLPRVRGQMAAGTLRVEVRLPGDEGPARVGDLTFLDTAVQDASGTVKLRATLPNTDRHFWPGQFVHARLVLATIKDAVLVGAQAVQIGQAGPYVYVISKDSIADMRAVTLGQRQGERVVVERGVQAGERVVMTGHMGVTPGGKVLDAAAPQEAPRDAAAPAQEKPRK